MVAYWVGGEEDQRVDEDAGPDCGCELRQVSGMVCQEAQRLTIQMPACARTAVPIICCQYSRSFRVSRQQVYR